jgi:hypothetical protein
MLLFHEFADAAMPVLCSSANKKIEQNPHDQYSKHIENKAWHKQARRHAQNFLNGFAAKFNVFFFTFEITLDVHHSLSKGGKQPIS